jgi:hypothetical protein
MWHSGNCDRLWRTWVAWILRKGIHWWNKEILRIGLLPLQFCTQPARLFCYDTFSEIRAFFIADGQIRRERLVNDRTHQVVGTPLSFLLVNLDSNVWTIIVTLYVFPVKFQVDTFGNTDPDQYGNRKIAIGALHVLKQAIISFCGAISCALSWQKD